MSGKVIGLANRKGGVGKTTLALHLAVGLARRGHRVVLVDADPQGNLTSWLLGGFQDDGLYRLLVAKKIPAWATVLQLCRMSGVELGLLSGDGSTSGALAMLAFMQRLPEVTYRLRQLATLVPYVLMDMPPSQAVGFEELLAAADWVLVPAQMERMAIEGVAHMAEICRGLEGTQLLGVIPNMVRNTTEHREQGKALVEVLAPRSDLVWPPMPLTIKVAECHAYGTSLWEYAPGEEVTGVLETLVDRFLAAVNGGG